MLEFIPFVAPGSGKKGKTKSVRRRRLVLESLENRELLSVSPFSPPAHDDLSTAFLASSGQVVAFAEASTGVVAEVENGILTVTGTEQADNIEVKQTTTEVIVSAFAANGNTKLASWNFSRDQVSEIVFFGFGGNDTFLNGSSVNCTVYGGDGNDRLVGGTGKNILDGGNGDNMVIGGTGVNIFHNTGTGSSAFVWRGSNDSWGAGSKNGYDDAQMVFSTKGRSGTAKDSYAGVTYAFRTWQEKEIFQIIDIVGEFYAAVGTYAFVRDPSAANGAIYFTVTDASVDFSGTNVRGDYICFPRFAFDYTPPVIHEIAHNWDGNIAEISDLWAEFRVISWNSSSKMKSGAVLEDFAWSYGMTDWYEDWATAVEDVFYGETPPNATAKWRHKVEIVQRFFQRLADWRDDPVVTTPTTPAKAVGVTKSSTITSITLSWKQNGKNSEYLVACVSHSGIATVVTDGLSTTFEGLQAGVSYRFAIVAKNDTQSANPTYVWAKTQKYAAVKSVRADKAATTLSTVTLNWKPSPHKDTAGYAVFLNGNIVWSGTETRATINGLKPSKRYRFVVRAIATVGDTSIYSKEAKVWASTLKTPTPRIVARATATPNTINLQWAKSKPVVESAATYELYFRTAKTGTFEKVIEPGFDFTNPNYNFATITGLASGTSYEFRITATFAEGGTVLGSVHSRVKTLKAL